MVESFYEIRQKEVICANECRRLGCVSDIVIDLCSGKIVALIVPMCKNSFKFWGNTEEYKIPWEKVKKIGNDIILVELDCK